jgi:hypothetical protein
VRAFLLETTAPASTFHSRASAHVLSGIRIAAAEMEQAGDLPARATTSGIALAAETLVEGALRAAGTVDSLCLLPVRASPLAAGLVWPQGRMAVFGAESALAVLVGQERG